MLPAEGLQHLERALFEEDAAVAALAHQPEAGAQRQGVLARAAGDERALVQLGHEPVPGALAAVGEREQQVGGGADDLLGADFGALGPHPGLEGEEAVDPFLDLEALQQQRVLAQHRLDRHQATGLRVAHGFVHRLSCRGVPIHRLQARGLLQSINPTCGRQSRSNLEQNNRIVPSSDFRCRSVDCILNLLASEGARGMDRDTDRVTN